MGGGYYTDGEALDGSSAGATKKVQFNKPGSEPGAETNAETQSEIHPKYNGGFSRSAKKVLKVMNMDNQGDLREVLERRAAWSRRPVLRAKK